MRRRRFFLIGMLCGVMITSAFTYAFAIPANSNYWRMEIWKRGGAAWTFDRDGNVGWNCKQVCERGRDHHPAKHSNQKKASSSHV